jgi:hypothetical protein
MTASNTKRVLFFIMEHPKRLPMSKIEIVCSTPMMSGIRSGFQAMTWMTHHVPKTESRGGANGAVLFASSVNAFKRLAREESDSRRN